MKRSTSISRLPLPKVSISTSTPNSNRLQRSLSSSSIVRSTSSNARSISSIGRVTSSIGRITSSIGRPTFSSIKPSSSSRNRSRSPYKNNKNWLVDQHTKICEYLLTNHPNLYPDGVKIQPPTIATFVEVTNLLFQQLDPRISITVENYKTTVPENLKIIQYPHPVAPSFLKTVNTMHAWPQVISLFSWLIDFITFIKSQSEDDLNSIILNYFALRYLVFCKDSTDKDNETVDEDHKKAIEHYFKIDKDALAAAEAELKEMQQHCNEKEMQLNEKKEKNEHLKAEINKIQAELDEFYGNDDQTDAELLKSIEDLGNQIRIKENAIKSTTAERQRLEEIVNSQTCSIKDKQILEAEIENLKSANELKKEYFAEKRAISDELDFNFIKTKNELDQEICRINKELLPHSVFNKELSKLELSNSNFVASNFEEEFQEYLKKKETLEKQYNCYLEELKTSTTQTNVDKQILQEKKNALTEHLTKLNEKRTSLESSIKSQRDKLALIISEANTKVKGSFEDMEIKNTQTMKNALTELNKLYDERSLRYKLMGKRGMEMATTLHNLQVEKRKAVFEAQKFVVNAIENNLQQIYDEQSKFLKQFEQMEKDNSENCPAPR